MDQAKTRTALAIRGFTLLELVVALAIGSLVVVGVRTALGAAIHLASREQDRAADALRVEAARAVVRQWLEGAHLAMVGRDQTTLGRPTDEIAFVTVDPGFVTGVPEAVLHLRLHIAGGEHGGLMAEYGSLEPGGHRTSLLILPEVGGMNIRYLVNPFDVLQWSDSVSSDARLPRAVEIRFSPRPGDTLPDGLMIPLFVTLPRHE